MKGKRKGGKKRFVKPITKTSKDAEEIQKLKGLYQKVSEPLFSFLNSLTDKYTC